MKDGRRQEPGPMGGVSMRQDIIRASDFNFLTVLGKGSFGKVRHSFVSFTCWGGGVAVGTFDPFITNRIGGVVQVQPVRRHTKPKILSICSLA